MKYASIVVVLAAGCLSSESEPVVVTGEQLTVRGEAALGCGECPEPGPELSTQTPSALHIGVAAVELLRSEDDPNPHEVLVAAPAHDADLVAGATFAAVDTGSIPEGVYTHMRVTLDWIRYTVDATGHANGFSLPGALEVDYALSDYDDDELGARVQGDYLATFSGAGMGFPQAGTHAVDYPSSHPGGTVDLTGGRYRITFPAPDAPIVIEYDRPASVDVDVTYFIDDAFGWIDLDQPDFADGVFDLAGDPSTEVPASMAIQGFAMDVQPL